VAAYIDQARVEQAVTRAGQLPRIHAVMVAHDGKPIVERVFRGPSLDHPVNIRSASKAVISTLIGIAIAQGMIKSLEQPILPLLKQRAPANLHPKVAAITIHHLLSMRAGLERTSGQNYRTWVQSPNWVSFALSRGFSDEPGGNMVYSTGNTHLLSTILTDISGADTWQLARSWLGEPLGITFPPWMRDPQGVFFGGDEMLLSPRDLLRFGEMYRVGGRYGTHQVVPGNWVHAAWSVQAIDRHGRGYGYGWFVARAQGHPVYSALGIGGQLLFVIPSLKLTIVVTSDPNSPPVIDGHVLKVYEIVANGFMLAAMEREAVIPDTSPPYWRSF
jgi:CubicO group peptidase (beta-lactamase class C family)